MLMLIGKAEKNSIHVEDVLELALPEAGMINGIITNTAVMTDFFDLMVKNYGAVNGEILQNRLLKNDTQLVIHTNSIQTKIMEVPPVRESQILEFLRREFSKNEDPEETAADVNDYTVLNPKGPSGGVEILAASASRELLESYRTCLTAVNIKLKGINIGVNCLIKLVSCMPQLQKQTFLLSHYDHGEQTVSMFIDGVFRLSNRYRILNTTGTAEWFGELGKNLAAMLQFSRAQRGQAEIKRVFNAGLTLEQLNIFAQYSSTLNVALEGFDMSKSVSVSKRVAESGTFNAGTYLFNLGSLVKR
jgi:hypothetical protein